MLIGAGLALTLLGCKAQNALPAQNAALTAQATPESYEQDYEQTRTAIAAKTRPDGTEFSQVLQEYKDLNSRILRLLAPLRIANAQLCAKTERDPGFITHHLGDYPLHMRGMAQALLGLSQSGIYIRNVRAGSPAHLANIQEGDKIIAINDKKIADVGGATQKRFYNAIARNAFNGVRTRISLQSTQGEAYTIKLRAQTACDIPASVIFSEDINGYTDGAEIVITSALLNSVEDDIKLSLILAHEMSHIIAGHMQLTPSAALELEADRMALVLMQNAGLDIDKAISFWQESRHPHPSLQNASSTHPSLTARYENFRKEQRRIKRAMSKGETLGFK